MTAQEQKVICGRSGFQASQKIPLQDLFSVHTLPLAQQSHQPTHTASRPSVSSVNGMREISSAQDNCRTIRPTGETRGRLEAAPRIIILIHRPAEDAMSAASLGRWRLVRKRARFRGRKAKKKALLVHQAHFQGLWPVSVTAWLLCSASMLCWRCGKRRYSRAAH